MIVPTGHGMTGCHAPTPDERLQAYAARLAGHFDAHGHARRAAAGLALLTQLRRLWRKRDQLKRRPKPKAKPKPTNVVPLRRRA